MKAKYGCLSLADYPNRVDKGNSLNIKEMIKEGTLEYQQERTWWAKICVNTTGLPFPLEFSKLCLTVEAKSCNPDMIINEVEKGCLVYLYFCLPCSFFLAGAPDCFFYHFHSI